MTAPHEPDDRDPLAAYADGDPNAVRAAAPLEPTQDDWDAVHRRICARLDRPRPPGISHAVLWVLGGATGLAAASVAWLVFGTGVGPKNQPVPEVAEVVGVQTPPPELLVPSPHEGNPDPLAEFVVLPMAQADDVVLHRVPGEGWLPVGAEPLPGTLALATASDVKLDNAEMAWPNIAPGFAPMIFAAKPR